MRSILASETKVADATAIGVNALAGYTWVSDVNSGLQLILTVAGIVAAIAAAQYHFNKTKELKKRNSDKTEP